MIQNGKRRAFMLVDAVTGIAILGALLAVFAAALGRQHHASESLADSRAAWRKAESALSTLQIGHLVTSVEIRPLAGGQAPAGFAWVEVVATEGAQTARLSGIVPKRTGGTP